MGSDRARVSDDPKQEYRSVVMQQGRVTLEADFNEEVAIAGEELLEETLDIVGPSGTPKDDEGYLVTPLSTPHFDFSISPGTMYVGGLRVSTPAPGGGLPELQYSQQMEWLDHSDPSGDADWVDPSQSPPTSEFIYLFLREQEVSAVEDSDLKDVALGGPDTAQRTRLIQHIARLNDGPDCASGLAAAIANWETKGLNFDGRTMRLESSATLRVVIPPSAQPPDPCNPQAQGGYLGADNQLIRVQISGIDQATGNPKFVWGFDDASFLYRLDVNANDPTHLHFQSRPVDASHNPQAHQAVEVLRSAAQLSNGEYVASLTGVVLTLDKPYDPDSQIVTLPATLTTLPVEYYNSTQTRRVFLRVWEQELVFTPGTPVNLGDTGLQITIQGASVFHPGDFWLFAVRPSTPQQVYPERYLTGFQSPEGPRMWVCPLGVIAWTGSPTAPTGTLVDDCRNPFDNLVDLTKRQQGCCTITAHPEDVNKLQSIIDQVASVTMDVSAADPGSAGNNIAITISNVRSVGNVPAFDLTVTETDVYSSLTMSTIESILGDNTNPGSTPGLAHVIAGSLNTAALPANNQLLTLSGGQDSTRASAAVSVFDQTGSVVFILEAKKSGADGNLTTAVISSVDTTNSTFTLSLTWTKRLTNLSLGNFMQRIQTDLAYEITATSPAGHTAFPPEGVTMLTGGTDGAAATAAKGVIFGNPTRICLRPGNYRLSQPLKVAQENSNLTIEGCPGGVTISVAKGQEKEGGFINGLIHLTNAQNITLRDLTFEMPLIAFFESGGTLAGLSHTEVQSLGETALLTLAGSVGLTVADCRHLTIEHCNFDYPTLQPGTILFAVGILATGDCSDLRLGFGSFQGPDLARGLATAELALVAGYLQTSIVQPGVLVPSTLFNASFSHNVFENLDVGVLLFTTPFGITTFESNVMRACLAGILSLSLNFLAPAMQAPALEAGASSSSAMVQNLLASKLIQQGISVAASYPLPIAYVPQRKLVLTAVPAKTDTTGKKVSGLAKPTVPPKVGIPEGVQPLAAHVLLAVSSVVDTVAAANARLLGTIVNFTGNDIDAFLGDSSVGGPAIFFLAVVFDPEQEGFAALNMMANKLRNNSATVATVLLAAIVPNRKLLGTVPCIVTGNLIENRQKPDLTNNISPKSLVVGAPVTTKKGTQGVVAITGNILVRPADYPKRIFPASLTPPFDNWDFMNTVVP